LTLGTRERIAAIAALLAVVALYSAFGGSLPGMRTRLDVAFVAFVVIPVVFAFVWLVLPWRDVRGVLGIDPDVRKGFNRVTVEYDLDADCDEATKDALLAGGAKYSAVFDMLANPTEVSVTRR